jgi:hypothetical protein
MKEVQTSPDSRLPLTLPGRIEGGPAAGSAALWSWHRPSCRRREDRSDWLEREQIVVLRWREMGGPADRLVIDVRPHRTEGPFSDADWLPRSQHGLMSGGTPS